MNRGNSNIGVIIPILNHSCQRIEFGKNAFPSDGDDKGFLFQLGFVWRQIGVAFFGAWLRLRTFLFSGDINGYEQTYR